MSCLKKYEIIKENNENPIIKFYTKILFSLIIFCIVVTLCKMNPDTGSYVKKVLNNSCDFTHINVKTSEFIDKIKDYIKFEEIFVWEE